jgi:hypothetical protein
MQSAHQFQNQQFSVCQQDRVNNPSRADMFASDNLRLRREIAEKRGASAWHGYCKDGDDSCRRRGLMLRQKR